MPVPPWLVWNVWKQYLLQQSTLERRAACLVGTPDASGKFRVFLGGVHTCSCGAGPEAQPCEHVGELQKASATATREQDRPPTLPQGLHSSVPPLGAASLRATRSDPTRFWRARPAAFVLTRVFQLDLADERVWQQSLLDSELERLIDDRALAVARLRSEARELAARMEAAEEPASSSAGGEGGPVAQRPIDAENGERPSHTWCEKLPSSSHDDPSCRRAVPDLLRGDDGGGERRGRTRLVPARLRQERSPFVPAGLVRPPGFHFQAPELSVLSLRLG